MPCITWEDAADRSHEDKVNKKTRAALCAVLTVLELKGSLDDALNSIDFKEAGVKRVWLEDWWEEHKKEDEIRRANEERSRITQEKVKSAISKLTPEERKLLGI